jgi:succinate dehydrogenase / fumarate reductase iron-sulfur subunit
MRVVLRIQRFDPERDAEPYYQEFHLEADPAERMLDGLMRIKDTQDGSLSFRKSCAHGVCGSDAMRINGQDRLACKTLVKEVAQEGDTVTVEPLRHFRVQKDLLVDQEPFFEQYRSVRPYLITSREAGSRERVQSPEERSRLDDPTRCILCAACVSACPVVGENPRFLGPAAIVQASRFNKDSRDEGFEARLPVLDDPNGVWPCRNHFECTRCCPRSIKVTKLINESKRQIEASRGRRGSWS